MIVPFLDLRGSYHELREQIDRALVASVEAGQYILGPEVYAFERKFASYCQSDFAVGVGSGLDALRLSLLAVGVRPGDEVIVPSNTFIGTWLAVSHCGAVPVPVEPLESTCNIDPARIEMSISSRCRAIVPVHLYGQPADMKTIGGIAKKYGLRVVEDAAQAHGATHRGRRIGGHSDAVAWSFYPAKNLGGFGDGGMVTTSDPTVAEELALLRNYGSREKYIHSRLGWNSRLDPLQASILSIKLDVLDEWNSRRSCIAEMYMEAFRDLDVVLPEVLDHSSSAWHLFVVQLNRREIVMKELTDAGIGTLIHYPVPPHRQETYANSQYFKDSEFPVAQSLSERVLSLPIGPHLEQSQVEKVVAHFRAAVLGSQRLAVRVRKG